MRRLKLFIIIFLTIVCFLVFLPYFLLQTSFGAKIVSQQLSKLSSYTISIDNMHHSFANLYELSFDNVIIKDEKQELVRIPKLVIGLDKNHLWQFNHFKYITVINGEINHNQDIKYDNFTADTLKLVDSIVNTSFNNGNGQINLSLQQLNGGIKPFSSSGDIKYQFDLTSQHVLLNQLPMDKVLIQGFHRDNITSITNLGGNFDKGFFVSKLKILSDNSLDIEQLKVSNIHFQTTDDNYFDKYLSVLPKLTIRQLSIFESSIQLPFLIIDKGNFETANLRYDDRWHIEGGSIIFNADSVVWNNNTFSSVLLQLALNDQQVDIPKAMATWNNGNVNFSGVWKNNSLHLSKLLFSGVDYQITEKLEYFSLPDVFSQVVIDDLTVLPSMLINTNPTYPFTLINFEASGSDVILVKDKKLGLYFGTLFLKAEKGTINQIDVNYPDLVVKFDSQYNTLWNFSSLVSGGMVEAVAKVNPSQTEFLSLHLSAYGVSSLLLDEWKLVQEPPSAFNYRADLHGDISPFGLSGTFLTNGNEFIVSPQH